MNSNQIFYRWSLYNVSQAPQLPEKSGSPFKAIFLVLVVSAVIIAGLWFWRLSNQQHGGWNPGPVDVKAVSVITEDVPDVFTAVGEFNAVNQVLIAAEVSGRVAAIQFESGQSVQKGDVLLQLDDSIEQADLVAAQAQLKLARQQLTRAKELAPTGAITQELLQTRQAEFDQSTAAETLQVSSTQLLKIISHEKAAFTWLNDQRKERGLSPLSP